MSFWDAAFSPAIPVPGTSTPPSQTAGQQSPTLNDEVTEVIGQLERFWGGFRKQGQSAIQAARKDLGDYVSQAQKGINDQLANLSVATPVPDADATDAQHPSSSVSSSTTHDLTDSITTDGGESSSTSSSTSASTATLPDPQQQQQQPQEQERARSLSQSQTLLTRLQSSLPPDLLTTIRDTIPIPDSVRDPQARIDLAHAAQARVQGATARGEELLRGASVFLRDAVRVVPPDPQTASASPFSSASHSRSVSASASAPAPPGEASASVGSTVLTTRRGALLRALRSNPAILRVDPAGEERSGVLFAVWVDAAGRDVVRDESELAADDGILRSTLSTLVPGELSEDVFWTRYFFRVHQINQEDERRKAVLSAGPTDQDEDFSWEDEDEDAAPKEQQLSLVPPTAPVLNRERQQSANATSGSMSPQRSDDSFDMVSSGQASAAGDTGGAAPVNAKETSDGDDDDDDEEEGEDEESDWE